MTELRDRLIHQLERLGIAATVDEEGRETTGIIHAEANLRRGRSRALYALLMGAKVSLPTATRDETKRPKLVFSTYLTARTQDSYRRAGIQYLDAAGNAWLTFGDVMIDIRGRPRPPGVTAPTDGISLNLFSAGHSQVVLALLTWPDLWTVPQRQLARASGVSVGQVNNTLSALAGAGYGPEHRPDRLSGLLKAWAAAFPTGLARRIALATYRGDVTHVKASAGPVFLSGEKAVPGLLKPSSMVVYVDEFDPRLPVANRWRSDGLPNITVRRAFWGDLAASGVQGAPWPLVYADLIASEDPRVRAAAQEWSDQHSGSPSSS